MLKAICNDRLLAKCKVITLLQSFIIKYCSS